MAPLFYADQFLQFSSSLSSPFIYGLGEHRSTFLLDIHWTTLTMWARDVPPVVMTMHAHTHVTLYQKNNNIKMNDLIAFRDVDNPLGMSRCAFHCKCVYLLWCYCRAILDGQFLLLLQLYFIELYLSTLQSGYGRIIWRTWISTHNNKGKLIQNFPWD